MTTSHDALYRAICAEPDEDTPRLAFADLLEEDGDNLRAAFIRAQIAVARVPEYDPLHISTRQFEPDVLNGWGMAHTLPRVPGGCAWNAFEFRRGFPWKLGVLSLPTFVESGEAVFEAAPIQALSVDVRNIAALTDWPHLARIRRLEFSHAQFETMPCALLGYSPHAIGLTELACEYASITETGLEVLARSDLFPRLQSLELRANIIPADLLVDALAAAPEHSVLARLSLASNRLSHRDAAHLFSLPVLHGLQHLDLSDNPLGVEGIQSLAESGVLRGLQVLKLERTFPGVPGIKMLTETSALGGVRSLDLSANRLGPVAVKLLAQARAVRGLRVLNLSGNPIGDAGAVALAHSRSLAGLLELDLADAGLTDAGAVALAESPYLENLLRLSLTARDVGRPLGDVARQALVGRFGNRVNV